MTPIKKPLKFAPCDRLPVIVAVQVLRRRLGEIESEAALVHDDQGLLKILRSLETAMAIAGKIIGDERRKATLNARTAL